MLIDWLLIDVLPAAAAETVCDVICFVVGRLQTTSQRIQGNFWRSLSHLHLQFFNRLSTAPPGGKLDSSYVNQFDAYSSSAYFSYSTVHPLFSGNLPSYELWKKYCLRRLKMSCGEALNPLTEVHSVGLRLYQCHDWVCDRLYNFCVEDIDSTKTVRCFPSNKSWITSDLKKLLHHFSTTIAELQQVTTMKKACFFLFITTRCHKWIIWAIISKLRCLPFRK